ncbi:hypothetical protein F2Q70_00032902 [Brassica cretica]|uniref:DOG1 domain-containing protein n=1 Tax=Brassica cretica TaxID=69181 RepID=A0A8S9FJQ2_BRACR|nr:hypothetical protein F2Q70_00032902 [Brassica cretica]
MAGDLFRRNRPFNQLDGFYTDWSRHLTERCLPTLRDFPTDAKNEAVLGDIHTTLSVLLLRGKTCRSSSRTLSTEPSRSGTVIMETATSVTTDEEGGGAAIMEELVRIFREANQLSKSVITDIAGVLNMNQKVLFLESVCKHLSGFKHQVLPLPMAY